MKRKRTTKEQDVLNKCQAVFLGENLYRIQRIRGKMMQRIVCETKFKDIETVKYPPFCLDMELVAALIHLKRIDDIDGLEKYTTPHVVVYKHLLTNGYRVRPIRDNLIGLVNAQNHESRMRIVQASDFISPFQCNDGNGQDDEIESIAVVQDENVVFLAVHHSDALV